MKVYEKCPCGECALRDDCKRGNAPGRDQCRQYVEWKNGQPRFDGARAQRNRLAVIEKMARVKAQEPSSDGGDLHLCNRCGKNAESGSGCRHGISALCGVVVPSIVMVCEHYEDRK